MTPKSLLIAFLAISDQYATFILFHKMAVSGPFWMTENHFRMHFSAFQINTQLFCSEWLPAAILEVQFGPFDRKSLLITFLAISDQYATFFFHKMAAGGHFG